MTDACEPRITLLSEARAYVLAGREEGVKCPCCSQFAKVYKRKLNSGMAVALVRFYQLARRDEAGGGRLTPARFHHISELDVRGGDYGKLAYWRLLEPDGEDQDDGNNSGRWRITAAGRMFVEEKVTVPSYVYVYDGKPLSFPPEQTTIRRALGRRFDYDELMRG